jgi:penicillin-binding protein 1A
MTVRAASDAGMENVANTFRAMSIGDYQPYLSFALGAGETTVLKMTNAYSMLVNHGRELKPTLIDFVQSRTGRVIWPKDWKPCQGCNLKDWDGKPMPRFRPGGKQVMDPVTAYQVVHMLEGVVQRGTATILRDLNRPLFGKTGTTNGPTNVWFIGGTPNLIAGVYLGFDQPRNMGGYAQGGSIAAPIFKQFARDALAGMPRLPFTAPEGVHLVRIDRKTGKRVYGAWPDDNDPKGAVIWEAFKAETEPKRTIRNDELEKRGDKPKQKDSTSAAADPARGAQDGAAAATQRDQEFMTSEGGIY